MVALRQKLWVLLSATYIHREQPHRLRSSLSIIKNHTHDKEICVNHSNHNKSASKNGVEWPYPLILAKSQRNLRQNKNQSITGKNKLKNQDKIQYSQSTNCPNPSILTNLSNKPSNIDQFQSHQDSNPHDKQLKDKA